MYFVSSVYKKGIFTGRTWIYFESLEEAKNYAKEDASFHALCGYSYTVIEKISIGVLHSYDHKPKWYQLKRIGKEKYKAIQIDTPKRYKNIVGFAIG